MEHGQPQVIEHGVDGGVFGRHGAVGYAFGAVALHHVANVARVAFLEALLHHEAVAVKDGHFHSGVADVDGQVHGVW